jgi:hypothetical protein
VLKRRLRRVTYGAKAYTGSGADASGSGHGMYGGQAYPEKATKLSISVTEQAWLSAVI